MMLDDAGRREAWPAWVMGRLGERVGGRWRIVGMLGLGGIGAVYEVVSDEGTGAALKVLRSDIALGPEAIRRFAREAELAASIGDPGIVRVLDRSAPGTSEPWYVMERAPGADLETVLQELERPFGTRQAARLVEALLATLDACHDAGVVHRDVKPANLFVTPDLDVRLTDFGGALRLGEVDDARVGSPGYMAPEQAVHGAEALDVRCDVFAAGALLFRLIAGAPIRSASTASEAMILAATTPPPSLATLAPSTPTELVRIVDTALAFNPADRFATASAMREALQSFLASGVEIEHDEDTSSEDERSLAALRDAFAAASSARAAAGADSAAIQEQRRLLRDALRQITPLVGSVRRRGGDTKETQRRLDRLTELLAAAAEQLGGSSLIAVRPLGLAFAGNLVWEPDELLADVPHELFSLGVRSFRFERGFTTIEILTWVQVLAAAAQRDGTLEAALDPFVRGQMAHISATLVAAFDVSLIDRLADVDVAFGVARREIDGAMAANSDDPDPVAWSGTARALLRQAARDSFGNRTDPGVVARTVGEDPVELSSLRSTFRTEHMTALRSAMRDACTVGDVERLTPVLVRSFNDAIRSGDLQGALEQLEQVRELIDGAARDEMLGRMLDEHALRTLLGAAEELRTRSGEPLVTATILSDLLGPIAADRWPLLWQFWTAHTESTIGARIGAFVLRRAERAFPALGERLVTLPVLQLAAFLDAVAQVRDPIAFAALRHLGRHASDDVRLAAIAQRIHRGDNVDPGELQRLLTSQQQATRLRALGIVRESGRTGFAAMLSSHALSEGFHALPLAERQQVLTALHALSPAQFESVCVDLLRPPAWGDEASSASTRQLSAGLLGSLGQSAAAREALRTEARRVLRTTGELRAVARDALETLDARRKPGGQP